MKETSSVRRWQIATAILAYLLVTVLVSVEEWNWKWFLLEGDAYDAQPIPLAIARSLVGLVAVVIVGVALIGGCGVVIALLANIAYRVVAVIRRSLLALRTRFQ